MMSMEHHAGAGVGLALSLQGWKAVMSMEHLEPCRRLGRAGLSLPSSLASLSCAPGYSECTQKDIPHEPLIYSCKH